VLVPWPSARQPLLPEGQLAWLLACWDQVLATLILLHTSSYSIHEYYPNSLLPVVHATCRGRRQGLLRRARGRRSAAAIDTGRLALSCCGAGCCCARHVPIREVLLRPLNHTKRNWYAWWAQGARG